MSGTRAKRETPPARQTRVLKRPLIQAGVERQPGETVELGASQIEWLEGEGYFEPAGEKGGDK